MSKWELTAFTGYFLCDIGFISGYRLFKFVLFLVGFLVAFFFTYVLCNEYLTDQLSGKTLEYKDQVWKNIPLIIILKGATPNSNKHENLFLYVQLS